MFMTTKKKKSQPKKITKVEIYIYMSFFIAILFVYVYVQEKVQILLSTCIIPNCLY